MIRSIFVALYLLLFLIISLPLMLVFLLVKLFSKKACDYLSMFWVCKVGLGIVSHICGIKYNLKGRELIPRDEAVLFIGNHLSILDTIALYPLMVRPTGFIAKKGLLKIPVVNLLMMFMHCYFLDREDPRDGLKMINKSCDLIKNGTSIVIFPEGTRSKTGELLDFKEGSFKIAQKTKCTVVPMKISYDSPVFEDHLPIFKKTTASITFLEPIKTADWERKEFKQLSEMTRQAILECEQ